MPKSVALRDAKRYQPECVIESFQQAYGQKSREHFEMARDEVHRRHVFKACGTSRRPWAMEVSMPHRMVFESVFGMVLFVAACSEPNAPGGTTSGGGATASGSTGATPAGGSTSSGAPCVGPCTPNVHPLASMQQNPQAIAVDEANVYWTSRNAATVWKCAVGGCNNTPTPLADTPGAFAIAVDATSVYWTAFEGFMMIGSVTKCAIGGCGMTPPPLATGQVGPWALAVDAKNVYWITTGGGSTGQGAVWKCAVGGCNGTPTELVPVPNEAMFRSNRIAADGTNVYWGEATSGTLNRCSVDGCGGTPTVVASGQQGVHAIAIDGTSIYWSTGNSVLKCPLAGCNGSMPTTIAYPTFGSSAMPVGGAIAVDGTNLYWLGDAVAQLQVERCAVGGCFNMPTKLGTVSGTFSAGPAVNNRSVFAASTDTIFEITPK
jgi:hypothetical protein